MSETTEHHLDTETWGDRELLEVICSRYFLLGGQGVSELSWEVNGREGRNPSECLIALNRHLKQLSMIAVLDEGDPPIMSVGPLPSQTVVMPSWQQSLVWLLAASFTTLSGSLWISSMEPGQQPFVSSILETAIVFFTLPVLGSALLASYARIFVSKAFEVENSHLIPLAFPVFSPEWPFSLVSTIGQNRPDLHPIPNRKALGMIELAAPVVLFTCGTALTIIGLGLTSVQPPEFESSPVGVDLNLISEVLASILVEPHTMLRLQWIHPTGLAGIALSIVSWALLLPVPGFPGDRILHSLLGPGDMQDDRNQTSIFISTLGFVLIIFISTEYWPWLLIAAIAGWRRFSPEHIPEPFVVDEFAGLDEIPMRQIATLTIAILLLGYPGLEPSSQIDHWDGGISTEDWPTSMTFEGDTVQLELPLEPSGLMPVSGWLQMRVEGDPVGEWQINSECLDEREVCRFEEITQASPAGISVNLSREVDSTPHPFRLVILIDVHGHVDEHSIVFRPSDATTSIDPLWILVEDTETPRICVEIIVVEGDYINLTNGNQFWYFENETSLGPGIHDLCMRGHEGALFSQGWTPDHFFAMGPTVTILRNNQTPQNLVMPIDDSQPKFQFSDGDWRLPLFEPVADEFSITRGESESAFCPSTDVIVEVNSTGDWERELSDRSSILIPAGHSGNGTIRMSGPGWLAICSDTNMLSWYSMVEGPDVFTYSGEELTIYNRENYSMPISIDWTGDADEFDKWEISVPSGIDAMSSVFVNITSNDDSHAPLVYWVNTDENGINLNLAARSNLGD
tara:strand:- start:12443 stop:14830 length:2388 start_codon:yes stop_codon:yes gene_type:complete